MTWRRGNRLTLLQEREASGRVAEIFDEAKAALGAGYVPVPLQALGGHPVFLDLQWRAMRPLLGTKEFFESAARLRAEAYTDVHNYFKVPSIEDGLNAVEASSEMETCGLSESTMLLMLSVQLQAFEGAVGSEGVKHPVDRATRSDVPAFVDPETAPAPVRRVLDEIRHALELPYIPDEDRALASRPESFFAYWRGLKPLLNTAIHERMVLGIRESAWKCSQEMPVQVDLEVAKLLESGVGEEEMGIIARMTELLARGAAIGLINATFAKIAMEGGNVQGSGTEPQEERVA